MPQGSASWYSPSFMTMKASMASSLGILSSPTIWNSRPNVDTRSAKPLPKITCWCSTFLTGTSGKPVVPGCSQPGSNVSHPIIPIGTCMGGRLRISMDIGSSSRTQRGPCKESNSTTWHYLSTADVSSIGYIKILETLSQAVRCMAQHLVPGGVLLIEPWFTPETWRLETVHARFIDEPHLLLHPPRCSAAFV